MKDGEFALPLPVSTKLTYINVEGQSSRLLTESEAYIIIRQHNERRVALSLTEISLIVRCEANHKARIEAFIDKIWSWGQQYCYEHIYIKLPEEMGGGTVRKNTRLRRRCRECWHELLSDTFTDRFVISEEEIDARTKLKANPTSEVEG